MTTKAPTDLESTKAAAVLITKQVVDAPRLPLSYDPVIGDQALIACQPALLLIDPANVPSPNCDCFATAVVAMALGDQIYSPRCKPLFDQLPASLLGDATVPELRIAAQALFYLETRTRSKTATTNEVRVDLALVSEGMALRERMLRVLAYHCDGDPVMRVEIADIRAGTGYSDLASDLARVATHYFTHKAQISGDTKHYVAADEDRARGISNEILTALHATADNTIVDLRNRAWARVMRIYGKLKAAAEFIFTDSPFDLANFPALRHAVLQMTMRAAKGGTGTDTTQPDPNAPVGPAPVGPAPVAPVTGSNGGIGPGGSPVV